MSQDNVSARPWQLGMFDLALKKQRKLAALRPLIGAITGKACLLVTCGDNNGALNWHLRQTGGDWTWADLEAAGLPDMSRLLQEPVHHVSAGRLPYPDGGFDVTVAVDVLEHLHEDQPFLHELRRVTRPGGLSVVTVPNGDPRLWANRLRWRVGMMPAVYGHTRAGYTVAELQSAMQRAGFRVLAHGGYSRFFTEIVELTINLGYVRVLRRRAGHSSGGIAPGSAGELKQHGLAYRLYRLAFPMLRLISGLDRLLPASGNNAVIVTGMPSEGGR